MLRLQAFKYELSPDGAQRRQMQRFAGACRFVYNKALAGDKYLGYTNNCTALIQWKIEFPWMREAHSQVLQQSLKSLDAAFKNFFAKRSGRPVFKKKGKSRDSFRYPQSFKIEEANSRVFLPKIGWVRYRNSRSLAGVAKSITVSRKDDRWFISIQTEMEVDEAPHPSDSVVGIDMGIARFVTLSDGSHVEPIHSFRKQEMRLAKYQRRMSRKVKFSKNWKKAKAKVTKIHTKIAAVRNDFLHKASTEISKNHAVIVIEDLKVSNMSRSAASTLVSPGRKVQVKSGLNKSILDQGWGEFRRQLEYKQVWRGGSVIAVPAYNTSRTCPSCNHVSKENRKTQAQFLCVGCGFSENADLVGALNVLARGHRVLACGGDLEVRGPMKQEPTEEIQNAP